MAEKFTRFDAADSLTTPELRQMFFEEALADGDAADILRALATIARSMNFSQVARDIHVSRQGLTKALGKDGNPSFALIFSLVKALGLQMTAPAAANDDRAPAYGPESSKKPRIGRLAVSGQFKAVAKKADVSKAKKEA